MSTSRGCGLERTSIRIGIGTLAQLFAIAILPTPPMLAQITPDTTLGTEGSLVTPGANVQGLPADLIKGGAQRNTNLFHSFQEFNVNSGQRVYFANPIGIDNIFSRVTGTNVSNILGTLGVNGHANLFLLNPNGIIFGSNARLDINGSFLATTATSFQFPGGTQFSATNPQAPPLLSINVPLGVQYGSQPGNITNTGNLTAGQDLTLAAGNLNLQGQLSAGRDLTLQAQDTVQVRDSAINPFVASAVGKLMVQGNLGVDIFALNHLNSGFYSGGDMVLRSANTVGGDAHYWAEGNFRIETLDGSLGNLFSPYDPIILSSGDVSLGNYTGASLHIVAGGSVTLGNVSITGTDTAANSIHPGNTTPINNAQTIASLASVTLSDGTPITIQGNTTPTLDVRAGVDWSALGGFPAPDPTVFGTNPNPSLAPASGANITVGTISNPGGLVFLTNQYRPNPNLAGDITANQISTANLSVASNSGDIILDATGNVSVPGTSDAGGRNFALGSFADIYNSGDTGNAGSITIKADGNISIGSGLALTNSNSFGAINTSVNTRTDRGNAGNSGGVQLTSTNGNIGVNGGIFTNSTSERGGNAGNSGNVILRALQGSINIIPNWAGAIITRTDSRPITDSRGRVIAIGTTGDAGSIEIDARAINIQGRPSSSDRDITAESTRNGLSGNIIFNSQTPLNLTELQIGTDAGDGGSGNVTIQAPSLTLNNTQITTTSRGENAAGDIRIATGGSVVLTNNSSLKSSSLFGGSGNGGSIQIAASNLTVEQQSSVESTSDGSGKVGNILIDATSGKVLLDNGRISSVVESTDAENTAGDVTIKAAAIEMRNGSILDTKSQSTRSHPSSVTLQARDRIDITNSQVLSDSQNNTGGFGEIQIQATQGSVFLNQATVSAKNQGSDKAGDIFISARDRIDITNAQVLSDSQNDEGGLGQIQIQATQGSVFLNQATVSAKNQGADKAGDIFINAGDRITIANSNILADGTFGGIFVGSSFSDPDAGAHPQTIAIDNSNLTTTNAIVNGAGDAGEIFLRATGGTSITNNSSLSGFTVGSGQGASIDITTGSLLLDNSKLDVATQGEGNAGTVRIQASGSVAIQQQGRIQSRVESPGVGNGGNIEIIAPAIAISNGASIQAQSTGVGNSGNIDITGSAITITNGASMQVNHNSTNTAANGTSSNAGKIRVQANTLTLDNGAAITAETISGNGGDIELVAKDLKLYRNSVISTSAGSPQNPGNGGRISIDVRGGFVTAVPKENSDIIANAFGGQGGQITIQALRVVGLQARSGLSPEELQALRYNGTSDISVSSNAGLQGNIQIENQSHDPSQGLIELSVTPVDPAGLISQDCAAANRQTTKDQSTFFVIGRGGLPPAPDDPLSTGGVSPPWVTRHLGTASNAGPVVALPSSQPKPPLVEAQGIVIGSNGEVILTAESATTTPHQSGFSAPRCTREQSTKTNFF
ncbi:filamentous hemagglutinin N-terminal domain-containing protein [Allocoleopsis sp.]|uniref:two-partner secretion domain-containing protein n=1 Tax=Allocoleopsis sp. TaxID=3088169 RepID=UPI002FD0A8AC